MELLYIRYWHLIGSVLEYCLPYKKCFSARLYVLSHSSHSLHLSGLSDKRSNASLVTTLGSDVTTHRHQWHLAHQPKLATY